MLACWVARQETDCGQVFLLMLQVSGQNLSGGQLTANLKWSKLKMLSFVSFIYFINGGIFKYNSYCLLLASNSGSHLGNFQARKMKFLVNGHPE